MDCISVADLVNALLPQTQCRRCGYAGCRPYAEAVAAGAADFDRCPPGGQGGIDALAGLLGRPSKALDPAVGVEAPLRVARIDEPACIGCTLCIQACPVDAIIGAPKRLHSVVVQWCSGCDLCVAPCPVDCIVIVDAGREWTPADARAARLRFEARLERQRNVGGGRLPGDAVGDQGTGSDAADEPAVREPARPPPPPASTEAYAVERKEAAVAAALARARARRAAHAAPLRPAAGSQAAAAFEPSRTDAGRARPSLAPEAP